MTETTQFGAFVMTFNRPKALASTLRTLLDQTRPPDRILVIDNYSDRRAAEVVAQLGDTRVGYHHMGYNAGPAGGSAAGLERLAAAGCDWIYWGDDDDPPVTEDTLERLLDLATRAPADVAGVGAVGTRFDWKQGRQRRLSDSDLTGPVEVDIISGSSHMVVSRRAIAKVGVPNPELFFGFEDLDYCLRLRRDGYRLLVDGPLMHRYRERAGRLDFRRPRRLRPGRNFEDIWRQYYSTRSYIWSMRNEFQRHDLARREACRSIARAATSWGHGPRYGARFTHHQLRAVLDGYRDRLGIAILPQKKASAD
jgi:GT2 family glycosyltransferase